MSVSCTWWCASVGLSLWLSAGEPATAPSTVPAEVLRFDRPMAAVINARRWDETAEQWMAPADRKEPLFFDAVHRFLLLRFPGCAEVIHEKLEAGRAVRSARLVLH